MRKSELKQLVRLIVKEAFDAMSMSSPSDVDSTMASIDTTIAPTASADAAAKAKQERELRKATQMKLRASQKAKKLDTDKHKAEEKQWKIKKKAYDTAERGLKRGL